MIFNKSPLTLINSPCPAIRLQDLEKWLQEKAASEGGSWKHFLHNPQVYALAHEHASKVANSNNKLFLVKKKIVDLAEFRALLVQLFAISILWAHFKKADEFLLAGDAYNQKLNFMEFKVGVKSFCAAYGQEEITDEQLQTDFATLDTDKSNSISFNEVCNFCCKFIDPKFSAQYISNASNDSAEGSNKIPLSKVDNLIRLSNNYNSGELNFPTEVMEELRTKNTADELMTVTRSSMKRKSVVPLTKAEANEALNDAMDSVVAEVEKNQNIAQLIEFKITTELSLQEQGFESVKQEPVAIM